MVILVDGVGSAGPDPLTRMMGGCRSDAEYMFALYSGSVGDPGDRNPYADGSVLAKLWMRGYMRMLWMRIDTGPAMQMYLAARAAGEQGR